MYKRKKKRHDNFDSFPFPFILPTHFHQTFISSSFRHATLQFSFCSWIFRLTSHRIYFYIYILGTQRSEFILNSLFYPRFYTPLFPLLWFPLFPPLSLLVISYFPSLLYLPAISLSPFLSFSLSLFIDSAVLLPFPSTLFLHSFIRSFFHYSLFFAYSLFCPL